jgi:hypothetical protein
MFVRLSSTLAVLALLLAPALATAQDFEGVIKARTVEVEGDALNDVLYGSDVEEPEFDDEQAWMRWTANQLFDIPVEQFVNAGAEAMSTTLYIKGTKVRVDTEGGEGGMGWMMMDITEKAFYLVYPAQGFYVAYTQEEVEAMAKEMEARTQAMMEEMGIDMEEMEREAAEAEEEGFEMDEMMAGMPLTINALGQSEDINGFPSEAFEAFKGDEYGMAWCSSRDSGLIKTIEDLMENAAFMEEEDEDDMTYESLSGEEIC